MIDAPNVRVMRIAKGGANAWEAFCYTCGFVLTAPTKRVVTNACLGHECEANA